jgi:hypothetical protein
MQIKIISKQDFHSCHIINMIEMGCYEVFDKANYFYHPLISLSSNSKKIILCDKKSNIGCQCWLRLVIPDAWETEMRTAVPGQPRENVWHAFHPTLCRETQIRGSWSVHPSQS